MSRRGNGAPVYAWMWGLFLLTLFGDYGLSKLAAIPWWFWLIPLLFFFLALILTFSAHGRQNN